MLDLFHHPGVAFTPTPNVVSNQHEIFKSVHASICESIYAKKGYLKSIIFKKFFV